MYCAPGRNLVWLLLYLMTYWTRFVVAVNVVKPIIKEAGRRPEFDVHKR